MTYPSAEVLRTLRAALDTERYEYGPHSSLDDARRWLDDLERHWPDLGQVPEGRDVFPDLPVSGTPPGD